MYKFPALYHRLHENITDDIQAFSQIIKEHFRSICDLRFLELGCGTGRVTHALSQLGNAIGLDKDRSMLSYAQTYYGKRIFFEGSFPDFPRFIPKEYQGKWDGVIMPLNTLSHLDLKQLSALFEIVYGELKPGGIFLAGVLNPRKELEVLCNGDLTFEFKGIVDGLKEDIELYEASKFSLDKQALETTWYYYLGGQEVVEENHLLHLHSKDHYKALAKRLNFSRFEFYGDYDRNAWSESSKIILMILEK